MPTNTNPTFELNSGEKQILRGFLRGTQMIQPANEQEALWTPEAMQGIELVLDGKSEQLSQGQTQHLYGTLSDIVEMEKERGTDKGLTHTLVKVMLHITILQDWGMEKKEKKEKAKPGPKPGASSSQAQSQERPSASSPGAGLEIANQANSGAQPTA